MVKCAYCQKELERNVFCSNSHKVMFHTKGSLPVATSKQIVKEVKQPVHTIKQQEKDKVDPDGLCEHARTRKYCSVCN